MPRFMLRGLFLMVSSPFGVAVIRTGSISRGKKNRGGSFPRFPAEFRRQLSKRAQCTVDTSISLKPAQNYW